jgi:fructose-bisphosphate aldolase, class I
MTTRNLEMTAQALVADGKGILAADETVASLTRRFEALAIESTPDSRRAYREMLFTTPGISAFISGVIMHDETIRQSNSKSTALVHQLAQQSIIPGIKVDRGVTPFAGSLGEYVTEGLDGLGHRLEEYRDLGARFAKWRAVFVTDDRLPSARCTHANAHALARYVAICQTHDIVPIIESEVLMEGSHTIERCEAVTGDVLRAVFDALDEQKAIPESILLRSSMVISGRQAFRQASINEVAASTARCLRRHAPAAVPGIVFLSGGQNPLLATAHLSAINQVAGPKPWHLSFSYGRALQDEALQTWRGKRENVNAGQRVFYHRAKCNSAAALGGYTAALEQESAVA